MRRRIEVHAQAFASICSSRERNKFINSGSIEIYKNIVTGEIVKDSEAEQCALTTSSRALVERIVLLESSARLRGFAFPNQS